MSLSLIHSLDLNNEWRLFGGEELTFPLYNYVFFSPVAVYAIAPFLGPVIGPLISGFINQVSRISARQIDFPEDGATTISTLRFVLVDGTNYRPSICVVPH